MNSTDVLTGELTLTGRITTASNGTFIGTIEDTPVVYKPIAGERPLWDFPDGSLAHRELAAYQVARALGWDLVPTTWLGEGPFGPGMMQRWQQPDASQEAVAVVRASDGVPEGMLAVLEAVDNDNEPVLVVHEDSAALRRMALFDLITNNADRKGGHVLAMADGHRYGVDHGLTFHAEPKLRTLLWGWAGEPFHTEEVATIERFQSELDALTSVLAELIATDEMDALAQRCEALLAHHQFPVPPGGGMAIPWPPL